MYIGAINFNTYQLFFSFFLTDFICRVIKDFMIQGGDFVNVSFKSWLEGISDQFYVYILHTCHVNYPENMIFLNLHF